MNFHLQQARNARSRWASPASSTAPSLSLNKSNQSRGYFDDDDDEDPGATPNATVSISPLGGNCDDDVDPLDMFMASVGQEAAAASAEANARAAALAAGVAVPGAYDDAPEIVSGGDRDYEGYYEALERERSSHAEEEGDPSDTEGGLRGEKKAPIEPMKPVDHSSLTYHPFRKSFYTPPAEFQADSEESVAALLDENEISILGDDAPRPVSSFKHCGFPPTLLREIARLGYEAPTAIQMQALPIVLSGRDLIGLAKTGSGKTLSFVWPMIVHVLDQPQMQLGDGPIGLVLAPTRELAAQIYQEAMKFCKPFNIRVCAIFGGEGKWEMTKALKEAPEIVIATPGRFIDLANARATNLSRCTMIVLDEADRMFEMGFEYQVRSIVNNIRPDRQTVLFSATMKKKLEGFAREILNDPIRVVIGSIGQANPDIAQVVDVVEDVKDKWMWLLRRIDGWVRDGKVLIFAGGKGDTEEVAGGIRSHFASNGVLCGIDCLHGDKSQADRSQILRKFRTGELSILVATDVASRGLDIKEVRTVVNYSAARNIETHVHRIGRTGRMGVDGVTPGTAHTVLVSSLPSDASLAVDLLKNLQDAGQGSSISPELRRLAESSPRWMRMGSHRGGGRGAGNGSRPSSFGVGLGAPNAPRAMTSSMLAAATPAQGRASGKSFPPSSTGLGTSASGNAMGFPPTSTSHQAASNNRSVEYHKSTSPVLSGFVRSSDTLSSPSHQPSNSGSSMESNGSSKPASDQPQVRKRSRWDS